MDREKDIEIQFLKDKMHSLQRELEAVKKSLSKIRDTYPVVDSDSSPLDTQSGLPVVSTSFAAPLSQRAPRAMTRTLTTISLKKIPRRTGTCKKEKEKLLYGYC